MKTMIAILDNYPTEYTEFKHYFNILFCQVFLKPDSYRSLLIWIFSEKQFKRVVLISANTSHE